MCAVRPLSSGENACAHRAWARRPSRPKLSPCVWGVHQTCFPSPADTYAAPARERLALQICQPNQLNHDAAGFAVGRLLASAATLSNALPSRPPGAGGAASPLALGLAFDAEPTPFDVEERGTSTLCFGARAWIAAVCSAIGGGGEEAASGSR